MNTNRVKGTWNELKGKMREKVSHATGNTWGESKGIAQQVQGKVQNEFGNAEEALKKGVDNLLQPKNSKHD